MSPPHRLADELRGLREAHGVSGREAARRAGLSQSRLSRIERGQAVPTDAEVVTLCQLYRAARVVTRGLRDLARDLQQEQASTRVVLQRGAWRLQERIRRIEDASTVLRSFQPVVVIGLLQTPEYMREVFGAVDPAEAAGHAERMSESRTRRQEILDSQRRFVFVLSEGALRWNLGGPAVMVPQLEHLARLAARPNIRLGVIPFSTTAPLPPFHAFHLYDARAAIVGSLTATAIITDPRDVAAYDRAFFTLEKAASFGEDAELILQRVAADYRALP